MKPLIAKLALHDLRHIRTRSVADWGDNQAQQYIAAIWHSIDGLIEKPERYRLRNDIYPECRICFVGRHAILYRFRNARVEISRVLHAHMN